jgi:hypothetical protein
MKTSRFKFSAALSMVFVASTLAACGAGDIESLDGADDSGIESDGSDEALESLELGSSEQALMSCTNPDGTNSAMAAIAVAAAQELKRWQPTKDFVMFNTSGQCEACSGMQQAIKLTSGSDASGAKGKSRCADGKCAKLQALLDMQYEQAANKVYFQGSGTTKTLLSPAALRSRLVAKLYEQKACDDSPRDNDLTACPKEEHVLTFQSAAKGSCDTNFFFKATKTNGQPLLYPNQLKNKLKFADQNNSYIAFQNLGNGVVSIDPTYGLNEDGGTVSGSCTNACTKISISSIAGGCCACAGLTKKFVKAAWSGTTFLCQ